MSAIYYMREYYIQILLPLLFADIKNAFNRLKTLIISTNNKYIYLYIVGKHVRLVSVNLLVSHIVDIYYIYTYIMYVYIHIEFILNLYF